MKVEQIDQAEQTPDKLVLVIPATGDAVKLQKFISQLRDKFQARIVHMVGSRKETVITLQSPMSSDNILQGLINLPEVKNARDKALAEIKTASGNGYKVILEADSNTDDKTDQYSQSAVVPVTDGGLDSQLDVVNPALGTFKEDWKWQADLQNYWIDG